VTLWLKLPPPEHGEKAGMARLGSALGTALGAAENRGEADISVSAPSRAADGSKEGMPYGA
jgi:hypothetical protein